jgi:hypothetical protein
VKRCPQCPAKISKGKKSGSKKNQDVSQTAQQDPGPARERTSRPRRDHNYAEPDSDDAEMEGSPDEGNKEEESEIMKQGCLCTTADPRRRGRRRTLYYHPHRTERHHHPTTNRKRSNNMDDNSPSRIPAHKERRRSHKQQRHTTGQNTVHTVISKFITDWTSAPPSSEEQPTPEGKRLIQAAINLEKEGFR